MLRRNVARSLLFSFSKSPAHRRGSMVISRHGPPPTPPASYLEPPRPWLPGQATDRFRFAGSAVRVHSNKEESLVCRSRGSESLKAHATTSNGRRLRAAASRYATERPTEMIVRTAAKATRSRLDCDMRNSVLLLRTIGSSPPHGSRRTGIRNLVPRFPSAGGARHRNPLLPMTTARRTPSKPPRADFPTVQVAPWFTWLLELFHAWIHTLGRRSNRPVRTASANGATAATARVGVAREPAGAPPVTLEYPLRVRVGTVTVLRLPTVAFQVCFPTLHRRTGSKSGPGGHGPSLHNHDKTRLPFFFCLSFHTADRSTRHAPKPGFHDHSIMA